MPRATSPYDEMRLDDRETLAINVEKPRSKMFRGARAAAS
jgi:hypothetical protein